MNSDSIDAIHIRGAREHNLQGIDVDIPIGKMTVVTGPSGSGKSSLAMHTLYAEGQRRYMETFSPYVRQFMDRMNKPAVDSIDNIQPAIALHQRNSVKTSRSTVGTMTGLNDYWKFVFARLAVGIDPVSGRIIKPETPQSIDERLLQQFPSADTEVLICLDLPMTSMADVATLKNNLMAQGYLRAWIHGRIQRLDSEEIDWQEDDDFLLIQDRVKLTESMRERRLEALETAMRLGKGVAYVIPYVKREWLPVLSFRGDWYPLAEPRPELFSFNSPIGACPTCRGYGRVITIDYSRCINRELSVQDGAIHIFEGTDKVFSECKKDLLRGWRNTGKKVRLNVPWKDLQQWEIDWLMNGDGDDVDALYEQGLWYGVKGFFKYLETRTHKMHIRVYLSRFRTYSECPACHGQRLRSESLQFQVGGKSLPELFQMPMERLQIWMQKHVIPFAQDDPGLKYAVAELTGRLNYLNEVGLGYLTAERPTRSLSGGEIERVNLTACLGAALTDTLFVLDEPTVGLHPRDTEQLLSAMERLKKRGNTLVVVEHEEAVMRAADCLVDMGPGSGRQGGKLVYAGDPQSIERAAGSLTGAFLSGQRCIPVPEHRVEPQHFIQIRGATRHNLHRFDVDIPLGVFTCLTGVSGSGKSTLAHDVLYLNALVVQGAVCEEEPATVRAVHGLDLVDEVVLVDQSPIVRTPRSTPVVYTGIFEDIRALLADTDVAKARGMKPGFFSFNSGEGRCPRCMGMGSEKVGMQFLSDIFVECPVCHGSRYGEAALSVRLYDKNIAEILAMTVAEALAFFDSQSGRGKGSGMARLKRIVAKLAVLEQVGLGHLSLGQALNTLSGGENQRLKLAKILLEQMVNKSGKGKMLILDEPGTGLHFADIEVILRLFRQLVQKGHSLLVIEHNMEFIKSADYVIDLGPEGGNHGGKLVACGTPEQVAAQNKGYTAGYLQQALQGGVKGYRAVQRTSHPNEQEEIPSGVIALRGARHHNLKNVDLDIPRGEMTVLTGLSGSGKSSLAFDIFFAEGQRRFMDVMSPYARQFTEQLASPDIDRLTGLPPTVAIEQNISRGGIKSTVGTITEIWQFLRLMYAKIGQAYCPQCQIPVGKRTQAQLIELIHAELGKYGKLLLLAPLVRGRKGHYADLVRWAQGKGYDAMWIDGKYVELNAFQPLDRYSNHDVDLVVARLDTTWEQDRVTQAIRTALSLGDDVVRILPPKAKQPQLYGLKSVCPNCRESFPDPEPSTFSFNSPRGWCSVCRGNGVVGKVRVRPDSTLSELESELQFDRTLERHVSEEKKVKPCPACHGVRLNAFARAFQLQGVSPGEIAAMSMTQAAQTIRQWQFDGQQALIAGDIVAEVEQRLDFLQKVGLGYLSLDRNATALSGGEAQRIRLAAQLGAKLRGVLYVLDEPTIGLHPQDNDRLLDTLDALKQRGNTLLVVEHDEDTMRRADNIVDVGPGAGIHGGRIVAQGSFAALEQIHDSVTGTALHHKPKHPYRGKCRRLPSKQKTDAWLRIDGCCLHNLKNIDAAIPKERLTVITGVSGAGKTSLMTGTIRLVAKQATGGKLTREQKKRWRSASGFESIRMVYSVDQSPIGKTPRSTPATYIGVLDEIRTLFAQTPDARRFGFDRGRFSFNTGHGHCEMCKGTGLQKLEMDFLPPAYVTCETCCGKRYNAATLAVRYKDKTIADVLDMDFEQAAEFFASQPRIAESFKLLTATGLGYLTLGQASNTLSGGEAQRLKLVTELIKGQRVVRNAMIKGKALPTDLYLIEEPSIGLHPHDVRLLIDVLHRLVEQGHTVVVIEHNPEIMAEADYLIDMGPGSGENGGQIVACGTPQQIAAKDTATAPYVRRELFPEGASM